MLEDQAASGAGTKGSDTIKADDENSVAAHNSEENRCCSGMSAAACSALPNDSFCSTTRNDGKPSLPPRTPVKNTIHPKTRLMSNARIR